MPGEVKRVAIIGAGVMGIQIALKAARTAGNIISLTDISEKAIESSKVRKEEILTNMVNTRLISESDKGRIRELITFTPDLEKCLEGVDLVIEAIIEELQPKRELFRKLNELAPAPAILASNSSTIPISRMEDVTRRMDKVLNIHFYDPELIPMVDLMGGSGTSERTMTIAERWVKEIDCVPIRLKKENLGFCMNHIWHAARIEALKMWADGVVDFQDIDRAWMVFLRLPFGLFGLMDRVGLDTVYNVHAFYYNETKDISQKPPDKLKEMIDRGELGEKTGKGFYSYPNPEYAKPDFLKG
jgi:3-hydroxybutyryl-CoA dehydrogenase